MNGYVYILTNPSMPGLVKVGRTTTSPEDRARQLYQTGVPTPFEVYAWVYTPNCDALESFAHGSMYDLRVSGSREFFRCEASLAHQVILDAHREQVEEWLGEFLPDHTPVHSSEVIDFGNFAEAARQLQLRAEDLLEVLSLITADEMRPAFQRYLEREAAKTASHILRVVPVQ